MDKGYITVLVADDHPIMVEGLSRMITGENVRIVATAFDGKGALEKIMIHQPALAILDMVMPGMTGLEVAKVLHRKKMKTKVILLTGVPDDSWLEEAAKAGVSGYVLKDNTPQELMNAIFHVMRGDTYVSPILGNKLLKRHVIENGYSRIRLLLETLTPMERKVLALVAENMTSRQIGKELKISEKTVTNHRTNICQKLGLEGSNALLHFAMANRQHLE